MTLKILICFFSSFVAHANKDAALTWRQAASTLMQKIRDAGQIELNVEKTVVSDITEQQTVQKGKLFLAKALFRFESENKEILVFDGKNVWTEQPGDKDLGIKKTVTKSKVGGKTSNQALLGKLLTEERLSKHFDILDVKKVDGQWKYKTTPKDKNIGIILFEMAFNKDETSISEIAITDDIGSKTVWKIKSMSLSKKSNSKLFQYNPTKDAQVIEI